MQQILHILLLINKTYFTLITNFIIKKEGHSLKKNEVKQDFTKWYQSTYGSGCPRPSELYSYLEKKLGSYPSKPRSNGQRGWENYTILREEIYE